MEVSLESKILEIIKSKTEKEGGVIQSTLWSMLGIDNREGTKIVLGLVRKGLIKREPVTFKGRRTYKLIYSPIKSAKLNIVVKLNPVMYIPCFTCRELLRCGMGGYYNPYKCLFLSHFIENGSY